MMRVSDVDLILITQSEVVHHDQYGSLPLERVDLYRDLVYPRMAYFKGGFRSHLDVLNALKYGRFLHEAPPAERRGMYSIWNLPGFVGPHLANFLRQYGVTSKVINNIDTEWDLLAECYGACATKPLVGISTTFHLSYAEISRLCKRLRAIDPCMDIVLGGAFVNAQTLESSVDVFERPMRKHGIRYILHGFNSEADLRALVLKRKEGAEPVDVPNLAFLSDSRARESRFAATPACWHEPVLNQSPALWNQLDLAFVNHTIQLRTTSGCPFECAFCSYPKTAHGFFQMDIECVERHIQSALRIPGVRNIVFIDDTFNVPADRFEALCRMFTKYEFNWFSFLRCQFVDKQTAQLMKESGCVAVYLGIESANDTVLSNMNKRATQARFREGVMHLQDAGIAGVAAFVLGFPGETDDTLREDIEFIESTQVPFYTLKEFYYMHHTGVYDNRARYGLEGDGADWRHNTMDSETARRRRLAMFQEIRGSVFVDPDSSLWYLAYLYDQGFSLSAIREMQRQLNAVIQEQMAGRFDDAHPAFDTVSRYLNAEGGSL